MSDKVTNARLFLTGFGIAVWGYGFSRDDDKIRLAGIALLAVSLILRFFRRKPAEPTSASE